MSAKPPVKRCLHDPLSVSQTNAWVNGELERSLLPYAILQQGTSDFASETQILADGVVNYC